MSLLDPFLLAMAAPQQGAPSPWLQLIPFAPFDPGAEAELREELRRTPQERLQAMLERRPVRHDG